MARQTFAPITSAPQEARISHIRAAANVDTCCAPVGVTIDRRRRRRRASPGASPARPPFQVARRSFAQLVRLVSSATVAKTDRERGAERLARKAPLACSCALAKYHKTDDYVITLSLSLCKWPQREPRDGPLAFACESPTAVALALSLTRSPASALWARRLDVMQLQLPHLQPTRGGGGGNCICKCK